MTRPKCKHCGGPLDLFPEPDDGNRLHWHCNNPKPLATDEEFDRRWENLPGDDVVRLERWAEQHARAA